MNGKEESLMIAGGVADDITQHLQDNHIATILYGPLVAGGFVSGTSKISLLVVLDDYNSSTIKVLHEVISNWQEKGPLSIHVCEMADIQGMEDSVIDEMFEVTMNYKVLSGRDILEEFPNIQFEPARAQAELAVRRYIFSLRSEIIIILDDLDKLETYLNNLAFFANLTLKIYYRILDRNLTNRQEHYKAFYDDFPDGRVDLEMLINYVYGDASMLDKEPVELIARVLDNVFQPVLKMIDAMGNE